MTTISKHTFALTGTLFLLVTAQSQANTTLYSLGAGGFFQDWSNTGLISASDDWSGVPSIVGYRGDESASSVTGVDPSTVLSAAYSTVIDVNANQANPDTVTTGGVSEFDSIANPVVALQGSGTADFPNLVFYVSTLGVENISISYDLRDIDGSTDNAIQPVALQYRIGNSGDFINVASAFLADASSGPSLATLVTPVSATLAEWSNQSEVQFRIITSNAVGNDEHIGIDNISIVGTVVPEPTTAALAALFGTLLLARRRI